LQGLIAILLLIGSPLASPAASPPTGDEVRNFFRTGCISCHRIGGGRLVGPDLKDVTQRQERSWLVDFILDPQAKIDAGDPYALELLAAANGVVMVPAPGITREMAGALLDLITAESALDKSEFVGLAAVRELTEEDRALGEALFLGHQSLSGGGPPCISCHNVAGLGGLGGGRLGPDLTKVFERLGGAAGLSAWLASPPTAQMQATFAGRLLGEDEILGLAAYLDEASQKRENTIFRSANTTGFAALGVISAGVILVVFGGIWGRRLRGVRRPMIRDASKGGAKVELHAGGQNG